MRQFTVIAYMIVVDDVDVLLVVHLLQVGVHRLLRYVHLGVSISKSILVAFRNLLRISWSSRYTAGS
jgi:hypothetical protein